MAYTGSVFGGSIMSLIASDILDREASSPSQTTQLEGSRTRNTTIGRAIQEKITRIQFPSEIRDTRMWKCVSRRKCRHSHLPRDRVLSGVTETGDATADDRSDLVREMYYCSPLYLRVSGNRANIVRFVVFPHLRSLSLADEFA